METIYFNLVKQGLISFIQAIHDRSVKSDGGVISGAVRNTDLSDLKKKKINLLIRDVYDLQHEGPDAELKQIIEKLIYTYHEVLLETCTLNFDKSEGMTEKAIYCVYGLITETFLFLKSLELEDTDMFTVQGDAPLEVLAYFCSRYKFEHMFDRTLAQLGLSESYYGHPRLSKQKEDLFVDGLLNCRRTIYGLKENLEDYDARVRDTVLYSIKNMGSELPNICRAASTGTKTSILSFNFLGSVDLKSSYTPKEGTMKTYLAAAKLMIETNFGIEEALKEILQPNVTSMEIMEL